LLPRIYWSAQKRTKIVATRHDFRAINVPKNAFAAAGGAYSAPEDSLVGFGATSHQRGDGAGRRREEGDGGEGGREEGSWYSSSKVARG